MVADGVSSDESGVISTFAPTLALPRFRFVAGVGSGVSSGVKSPVPLIGVRLSVP